MYYSWDNFDWAIFLSNMEKQARSRRLYYKLYYEKNKEYLKKWNKDYYRKKKRQ